MSPNDAADVTFWRTTTSDSKTDLASFGEPPIEKVKFVDSAWNEGIEAAKRHFAESKRPEPADVEIRLPPLNEGTNKPQSYERWLDSISTDQKAFINAPTDKSIRLRGPAGSGKTLAITLKAVREALLYRDKAEPFRAIIVTHSWALASQISDSIDAMGVNYLTEIEVFPLLEIARSIAPGYVNDSRGYSVVGDDSLSGKQAQLDEIFDLLDEFIQGDWVTYRATVSSGLRDRFDSELETDRKALAWDLLIEFGSVIGAAAIFPGAGSELRYSQIQRAQWMLPITTKPDMRVVFHLYTKYMESLEARSLVTADQVLADFLSHLETHAWNRSRKSDGYDLVFVDEFHLFNPLERQVLHYLTRDVASYPRIFMALDPRQSPSEAFIGIAADDTMSASAVQNEDELGEVANFELTTVHRFSPQILQLVKHIHHEFPTYGLDHEWDIDFSKVESSQDAGPLPKVMTSATRSAEETDVYRAVQEVYMNGRVAIAVVDGRQWQRFSELASDIGKSAKYHVSSITGKSDIEGLGYRRKGVVVGPAEYLAGLQFDTVLVAGIPDFSSALSTANERSRILSLLYLAISRAQQDVRIFVNEDDGGSPEVLIRASANGFTESEQGSLA
ncbi:UvrD-helicase domain-containing protein [Rhodococcus sp. MALMAid1271]|uniref:UvrD-helicase domain-containing protein n=1 Tax=Rhodococcus sp. MALMAid1271 TaxID=3411744 RepID=UPI003BA1E8C1